jgi:ubiquitin-conjugating enzyme E2 variant
MRGAVLPLNRGEAQTRPHAVVAFEFAAIAAAGVLLAGLGVEVVAGAVRAGALWCIPVAAIPALLAADLATGCLHWFCDRCFRPETPWLGRLLIRPFREHHRDPKAIVRHAWLELYGNSCLPVAVLLAVARLGGELDPTRLVSIGAHAFLFWFGLAAVTTNQLHAWAHSDCVSRPVAWLQRWGLILSPERHAVHHRGGFDRSYCVTTGWMNPVLDRVAAETARRSRYSRESRASSAASRTRGSS